MIDINFNFITDTPNYWENFWDNEMGYSYADPDLKSATLKQYHRILWSKVLPNGEKMLLTEGKGYLVWKNFRFGSDSIVNGFRNKRNKGTMSEVIKCVQDYRKFVENYLKETNTIGGYIIFPKMRHSINQMRGFNSCISDRFDLTLECIRRFYKNEKSPLYETLQNNKEFFDLFKDFKGYVEFFLLQDLVNESFDEIKFWIGDETFKDNPMPQNADEYFMLIDKEINFVKKRNKRIENYVNQVNR